MVEWPVPAPLHTNDYTIQKTVGILMYHMRDSNPLSPCSSCIGPYASSASQPLRLSLPDFVDLQYACPLSMSSFIIRLSTVDLLGSHLVPTCANNLSENENFTAFCGTRRFVLVLKKALRWSLEDLF
jgi:hypothetical protein